MRPVPDDARTVRVEPDTRAGYQALAGYGSWSADGIRRLAMSLSGRVTPGVSSGPLFGEIRLWLPTALSERDQFQEFRDRDRVRRHVGGSGFPGTPGFVCPVPSLVFVGSALEDSSDSESRDMAACLGRFKRFWMGGVASGFIPLQVVEGVLSTSREHVIDSWSPEDSDSDSGSDSGSVDDHVPFPEVVAKIWLEAERRESYVFCFGMDESLSDGCSDSSSDLPLRPLWSASAPLDPVTSLGALDWAAVSMAPQESHHVWDRMWRGGHYDLSTESDESEYRRVMEEEGSRLDEEALGTEDSVEYLVNSFGVDWFCPEDAYFRQAVLDWESGHPGTEHLRVQCPGGETLNDGIRQSTDAVRTFRSVVHDPPPELGYLFSAHREFSRRCSKETGLFIPVSDGVWSSTVPAVVRPGPTEYSVRTEEQLSLPGDAVHFRVNVPRRFLNMALAGSPTVDPLASRAGDGSEPVRQIQVDPEALFSTFDARVIFTGHARWFYEGDYGAWEESASIDRTHRSVDDDFFVSLPLSALSPSSFTYDSAGLWMHCSVGAVFDALPERAKSILNKNEADVPLTDFPYPEPPVTDLKYAKDGEDEIREILVGPGLGHVNGSMWHDEEVGAIASVRLSSTCVLVARWKFHARVRR